MATVGGTHAVVLGASLAGTLAAAALVDHVDHVTLVERDRIPLGPAPRQGVPQARHAHLLWSGGAWAIEALLPGTIPRWLAAGARRIGLPDEVVMMTPQGWMPRFAGTQFLITCGRDLLDWVVREQVLADERVSLHRAEAVGLIGDQVRVTGVRLRDPDGRTLWELPADLIVDATGHGSRAHRWLADLGLGPVLRRTVDPGLAYATRVFKAPPLLGVDFPALNVYADPRQPRPGQTAILLPIENHQWIVTLSGTRGGHPPDDAVGFVEFARRVRHPLIGDLIATLEPVGPVYSSSSPGNRRWYFERLPRWPQGFVVLGDAVATYNPAYGHGMSVAARSAVALRDILRRYGLRRPDVARRAQRAIARAVKPAWIMATGQDIRYPDVVGEPPSLATRLLRRYLDRLFTVARHRQMIMRALTDVMTLSRPMLSLLHPVTTTVALLTPERPPLADPPLSEWERLLSFGPRADINLNRRCL